MALFGVDLGGTKIEAIAIAEPDLARALERTRVPTNADRGNDHIIGAIRDAVAAVASAVGEGPQSVGIGHPGVLDPRTTRIKNSNTQALNGRPLKADLEEALGVPVVVANDANCFAAAEAQLGAARGAPVVFGVILGTGVGGGVFVHGRVLHGAQGIAGEWGHNVLDESGPSCYCGKRGCVEQFLSGPAVESVYRRLAGAEAPLAEIAARAERGEPAAEACIADLCRRFGQAIAIVINILDPECVVLGGGVSNVGALYGAGTEAAGRHVFNDRLETRIVKNALGDSAGVYGAALLTAPGAV